MASPNPPNGIIGRIEYMATAHPKKIYAAYPNDDADLSQGFRDVSFLNFAAGIDRAAWWLDETLGPAKENSFETFTYFGPRDLRWPILFVAGMKTGRKLLLLSPRVQTEGMVALVEKTNCKIYLYDEYPDQDSPAGQLKAKQSDAKHLLVPKLSDWLPTDEDHASPPRQYNYTRSWEEASNDPVCVFHTSGSTNLPKPIVHNNRRVDYYQALRKVAAADPKVVRSRASGSRTFSCFMPQHIGGMTTYLFHPVYLGTVIVLPPVEATVGPELINDIIRYGGVSKLWTPPNVLQQIAQQPEILKTVRTVAEIVTGSAVVPKKDMDIFHNDGGPYIMNVYGSTETMPLVNNEVSYEDWPHLSFNKVTGIHFEKSVDDLYELVITRKEGIPTPPFFESFPDEEEHRSGDLFRPHPSKPDTWEWRGRADDKISVNKGQAICVAPMEQEILQSPAVKGALIGQDGRPALMLIVEPNDDESVPKNREKFIEEIWPYIKKANSLGRDYAMISKDMIYVANGEKSIIKTEKGDPSRSKTLTLFEDEINSLYEQPN